jgi:hypothetical protein
VLYFLKLENPDKKLFAIYQVNSFTHDDNLVINIYEMIQKYSI